MAFVRGDGESVEMPSGTRPRGENLTAAEVRRHRDILGSLLIDGAGLSVPDAVRVLNAGASEQWLRKRLRAMPRALRRRVRDVAAGFSRSPDADRV